MSKGSKPRPMAVDDKEFADRWDRTFKRKDEGQESKTGKLLDNKVRQIRTKQIST